MINTLLLALALTLTGTSDKGTKSLTASVEDSQITWKGAKLGGSHTGTIQLQEGDLQINDGKLIGGSFIVDMSTIKNEDLSGEYKEKLEGHLKSDDFFGVEKYPTAKFVITEASETEPGTYDITGDLTIKNTTESISFPATLKEDGSKYTASASLSVDRSKYDVRYGSDSFFDNLGDKAIYDDFEINVTLSASK